MGRRRKEDSVDLPTASKEPYYPLLNPPFKLKPLRDEVFYESSVVFGTYDREKISVEMKNLMRKSHLLRIRFIIYLCKIGSIFEKAIEDLDTTGSCDYALVRKYIELGRLGNNSGTKEDQHWNMLNQLHTAVLQVRACIQGVTTTSQLAVSAQASEAFKLRVKTPS